MMSLLQDNWILITVAPLLFCSIAAFALIIERLSFVFTRRKLSRAESSQILLTVKDGKLEEASKIISQASPFYIDAFDALLMYRNKSKIFRDEAVTLHLNTSIRLLRKRLLAIVTIAALAPMLGLLGTIIGLMHSFHEIGLSAGPVEPAIVADGLWQALITTAAGMVIAVLCVFFNAILKSKIHTDVNETNDVLSQISLQFEMKKQSGVNYD